MSKLTTMLSYTNSHVKKQEAVTALCKAVITIVDNEYLSKEEIMDYIKGFFPYESKR